MLRVRVLGELGLELDGEPLELPASRRARSLLGLLAVERRAHPRGQLAARFWPDVLDESARTSLRSALSALRKALGAAGDRAGAMAAYRRLQDRLRSELGIAPSAPTRELVESLRGEEAEAPAPAPAAPPVERAPGTVTLLFTDQVSSTETLQRLGDDEAERLRRTHFRLLRDTASAHGGQEVKNLGDGLMVAFTSAVDAVACAIGIRQAVHRHAEREGDDTLGVRVGLNVGEPIRDEDDYFGTPVVVAKRLWDSADAGQILASDVVRALVGTRGGFEFRPLGSVTLKA